LPRKKAIAASPDAPGALECPACKSKISSDGTTLIEQSGHLDELIDNDKLISEVKKYVDELESKYEAAKKELAAEKAKQKTQEEKPSGNESVQGQGKEKRGGDWWAD
jgi:hypothetical protein